MKTGNYVEQLITNKSPFVASSWSRLYLYIKDALLSEHKIRTVGTITRNRIECQVINIFLVHHFHDFCKTLLQCLDLEPDTLNERVVEFVDIAYDEVSPKHYKEEEVGAEIVL